MRTSFRAVALLLGLVAAAPAAALTITAEHVIFGPVSRADAVTVNSLDDRTIDHFEVLLTSTVALTGFRGRSVGPSRPLLVGGGQIQILSGRLESSSVSFGRRNFVWVAGTPNGETPIPEPTAAVLFVVGAVLVGARLRGRS